MSKKDPLTLIEEADGEPRWLAQALNEIWQRLPAPSPPAPARAEPPAWDRGLLAKLQLDEKALPLMRENRWLLAAWLKEMADAFIMGTGDEGDSKEGFTYLFTLGHAAPSSGPREKRGRV